jgi:signal peptidase II
VRELRPEGVIRRQITIGLGISAAVVVVDLLTKRYAATTFKTDPVEVIPGVLDFVYTENFGASFSLFQDFGWFLSLAAVVATGIVVNALRHARPLGEVIAFGLIGGGAVGNLIDRLARGEGLTDGGVIDWIRLPNFPVFNIADSSITVAVVLLILMAWRSERAEKAVAT